MLYLYVLSMHAIAKIFQVSPTTIMTWICQAGEAENKPPPNTTEIQVELDEIWHFLNLRKIRVRFGNLIVKRPTV